MAPLLLRLRRRWRVAWTATALAGAGLTGGAMAVMLFRLGSWQPSAAVVAGWTTTLIALGILWLRRPPLTATSVARHLNTVLPSVQESADLLIDDPDDLSAVARLQRDRIANNLSLVDARSIKLPRRLLTETVATSLSAAMLGAMVWFWPAVGAGASPGGPPIVAPDGTPEPAIIASRFDIRPPAYTAIPATTASDGDLEFPEGSVVTVTLTVSPAPDAAWMETVDGDSLPFGVPEGQPRTEWALTVAPDHSTVYRLVLSRDGRRIQGEFHRLIVVPDDPPTLTILQPSERITLAATEPWVVLLETLAGDDYGLVEPRIVATVASGYGEGVTFRETETPFRSVERRGKHAVRLEESIDLGALGMQPGDELYLYVRARDNRQPVANESRTETLIISIEDTSRVLLSEARGLAVDRMPEYFRSQRQIIIDTERLLTDRDRITEREFKDRSQNIGLDQHLLRLRYGELVGDEDEDLALAVDAETAERFGIVLTEPTEPFEEALPDQETAEEGGQPDPMAEVVHDHDDPENATRLAATVKSVLKASLAQMWEAELRLGTHRPREALPYEYRALELLKQVQQASRAYVLRTGFDPPPIDPTTTRLTGDLSELPDDVRRVSQSSPPEDELRLALTIIRQWQIGVAPSPGVSPVLEAGGRQLARLTLTDPLGYLEALGAMRELVDSIAVGSNCTPCLGTIEEGLLRALPATVSARPGSRPAASGEARAYFERLTDAP